MKPSIQTKTLRHIRICVLITIIGLALSGLTAFPLETELEWLVSNQNLFPHGMQNWLAQIHHALRATNINYPYLAYGTDWLAFAHLMLAVLFWGAYKNPVKNIWVIEFGMIACIAIFPLAFIAGHIRHIPMFWTLIDCSFGLFGIIPLWVAYYKIKRLIAGQNKYLNYL